MKLFGTRILQTLLGITILALTTACNREPETNKVSGDVKTRIPWVAEGGSYGLQEVMLSGVSSLYQLAGQYATFYIFPSVQGQKISGYQPKTRFLKSTNDVYVPEDDLSQQMAVIYAYTQRLAVMDQDLGAGGINQWPRDVGLSVRYNDAGNYEANNAFYDGTTDSMLIVPYTQQNLPIAVNGGILAHEHFHSLYYKIVEKSVFNTRLPVHGESIRAQVMGTTAPVKATTDLTKPIDADSSNFYDEYHMMFSRGINEGLADFWAFIYTGDGNFLDSSLPSEKVARSLDLAPPSDGFMTSMEWKDRVSAGFYYSAKRNCGGIRMAYCLGTDYARTLKGFVAQVQSSRSLDSRSARREVGKAIVKSLPLLRDALLNLKANEYFEPVSFFTMVENSMTDLHPEEKVYLEKVVSTSMAKLKNELPTDDSSVAAPLPVFPSSVTPAKDKEVKR